MKKIILAFALTTLTGCASIVAGNYKTVNVSTSNGQSVEASVFAKNGEQNVTLPTAVTVRRDSQDLTITVKEDACVNSTTSVNSSRVEPWFWGNLLTGGIFGSTTDSMTGDMWTYDENITVFVDKKTTCNKD